ncbi:hypothetical protein THAOC_33209 [Thalassiosira oceanica]|uniref:Uncharacterized protein n=1 Tax=Thalassiosira oceanica TaxID=159749 RepID=K0R5K6_THAOC|nr:hypothetical protein THAOC_33209 [Thalassiosira oceanica]|eukprot:EJK48030.1 hypothetical protein THAOC_33209 [Thalassiosira oceanica]
MTTVMHALVHWPLVVCHWSLGVPGVGGCMRSTKDRAHLQRPPFKLRTCFYAELYILISSGRSFGFDSKDSSVTLSLPSSPSGLPIHEPYGAIPVLSPQDLGAAGLVQDHPEALPVAVGHDRVRVLAVRAQHEAEVLYEQAALDVAQGGDRDHVHQAGRVPEPEVRQEGLRDPHELPAFRPSFVVWARPAFAGDRHRRLRREGVRGSPATSWIAGLRPSRASPARQPRVRRPPRAFRRTHRADPGPVPRAGIVHRQPQEGRGQRVRRVGVRRQVPLVGPAVASVANIRLVGRRVERFPRLQVERQTRHAFPVKRVGGPPDVPGAHRFGRGRWVDLARLRQPRCHEGLRLALQFDRMRTHGHGSTSSFSPSPSCEPWTAVLPLRSARGKCWMTAGAQPPVYRIVSSAGRSDGGSDGLLRLDERRASTPATHLQG